MKFGFGCVDISSKIPLRMDGYVERTTTSTGVLHPLLSTACVLQDQTHTLVMISVSILGVDQHITKQVKQRVHELFKVPQAYVIINATHTHASYGAARFGDLGGFFVLKDPSADERDYYERLPHKIVESVSLAFENLEAGSVAYFQQQITDVASNRVNPKAEFNDVATVFYFKDKQDVIKGVWTLFANHPTVLDGLNLKVTDDFIAYYHDALQPHYPQAKLMYLQGCAGDVSTRYVKSESTIAQAQKLGAHFAQQIVDAKPSMVPVHRIVSIKSKSIHFQTRTFQEPEVIQNQLALAKKTFEAAQQAKLDRHTLRSLYVTYQGLEMLALMHEQVNVDIISASMSLIQFDSLIIITTPTETFSSIDLEIQRLCPLKQVVVLGYTNGYVGYLVDHDNMDNDACYERHMMVIKKDSYKEVLKISKQWLKKGMC